MGGSIARLEAKRWDRRLVSALRGLLDHVDRISRVAMFQHTGPETSMFFIYSFYGSSSTIKLNARFFLFPEFHPSILSSTEKPHSVSLTTLSIALAIYSTFPVFAPAMLILPFFVI